MTAATRLAEFIVDTALEDVPKDAVALVRRAVLDSLGVMLAGAVEPAARIVQRLLRVEGGAPLCTVAGTRLRTSATWAALANGVAGHAHDFDDTSFALMGHPSVPVLAAVLAAGEAEMIDGRAVVAAYVVGFEVDAALGIALNPAHYERGWHATSTIGTLGCAAAAARVMGLDRDQTRAALGIAASLASGLKENFGSMTKPYHAGHAARNGVWAAQLAREGFGASGAALDGPQGFAATFGGGTAGGGALTSALDNLGRVWQLVASGIAVKPYPSCALTHSAIDALLELRRRHDLAPDRIAAVDIGVNRVVPGVLIHAAPTTALERKFSMQYCAAAALAEGRVGLQSFTDGPVQDAGVRDLMTRVSMTVDPTLPNTLEQHAWARVTVRLRDGRALTSPPRGARGHPADPLAEDELRAKFLACAAGVIPDEDAEAVVTGVAHLEDIPDLRTLTARLVAAEDMDDR